MLTLTVPGLIRPGERTLSTLAGARALARHVNATTQERQGLGMALCAALSLPRETPLAPLLAMGAGLTVDDRYTISATPVTLVADRDSVVLAGPVNDLGAEEASALTELLNRHFASDGVLFDAPRPAAWFARCDRPYSFSTSSIDAAVGRPIAAFLPTGPDAKTWERWQVEIQMLFHEHAINNDRTARGLAPVSGVWLSGNGRLGDVAPLALKSVFATGDASGDLARGLACRAGLSTDVLPTTFSAILDRIRGSGHSLLAMEPISNQENIARFDAVWLQPVIDALESGQVDALHLIADAQGTAITWRAKHPSWLARMTARLRSRALPIPSRSEE
ncbi:MAG TPA: hypothetical protein VGK44_07295 [Casimicrobiaceae bacterium]|jgi:hypothetical protein